MRWPSSLMSAEGKAEFGDDAPVVPSGRIVVDAEDRRPARLQLLPQASRMAQACSRAAEGYRSEG